MPVGYVKRGKYYIYNHAQIIVKYHATASGDAASCCVETNHWFGWS